MATHYIGTQQVLLHMGRRQDSYALQSQAAWLCSHGLLDRLQALFDRFGGGEEVLRIDTLDLDLGQLPASQFGDAFAARLLEALEAALSGMQPETAPPVRSRTLRPEERLLERWEAFLRQGYLSGWNGTAGDLLQEPALLAALEHAPAARAQIRELLRRQRRAVLRLLYQYPPAFWQQVLRLLGADAWVLRWIAQLPPELPASARADLQAVLIQWTLSEAQTAELLAAWLRTLPAAEAAGWTAGGLPPAADPSLPDPPPAGWAGWLAVLESAARGAGISEAERMAETLRQLPAPAAAEPPPAQPEAAAQAEADRPEALFVSHAGLVLLHPFLPALFENLGLLDGDQFSGEAAQARAVQVMGYLAAGSAGLPEHELPIAKLLCGYPLHMPVIREPELSRFEQAECEDLLASVIGHWEALKSTSPDGLREGFLQRAGKLEFREGETRLLVEEKGQDILLTRLPWGIGIVKLPWMEEILYVKWVN
ncbi:MAG: contractile injection system tape measure protein [Bacteroidia bacterium]|nr:contractile injection system tape measure protein [Bacteroidia bacterium]